MRPTTASPLYRSGWSSTSPSGASLRKGRDTTPGSTRSEPATRPSTCGLSAEGTVDLIEVVETQANESRDLVTNKTWATQDSRPLWWVLDGLPTSEV